MSNPNGKKGAAFERSTADCLSEWLEPELTDVRDRRIDRRVKTGAKDRGDVSGVYVHGQRVVVECKAVKTMALAAWVTEAEIERGHDDALVGLVVHKRVRVSDPLEQYVTMTVRDLVGLLTGERPDR